MKNTFILILMILLGCSESELIPEDDFFGYEYFPVSTGQYRLFEVQEINYLLSGEVVTEDYQLKEEITASFLTGGDSTFIINRFKRSSELSEWEYLNTWQSRKTKNNAIIIEGNIPLVKLVFPVENKISWNANALNTQEEDLFTIDSLNFSFARGAGTEFPNTLTVIQEDNQDFIVSFNRRFEVYALNVGLVYKETKILNYCANNNCLGQQIVETGMEYSQTLVEYGSL